MILSTLIVIFIAAFVALAVLGHVLLLGDLWGIIAAAPHQRDGSRDAFQIPAE